MFGNNPFYQQYYNNPYQYSNNQQMYQGYQQPQQTQQIQQQVQQVEQPQVKALRGKYVDNIEVVRATDINFDGAVNFFPLTDGSAIITKQIQLDGTSKMVIYKPEVKEKVQYITKKDLDEAISNIDLSDIDKMKKDIKTLQDKLSKSKKGDE